MKKFAGLDVHSKHCSFVVMDKQGKELSRGEFETTPKAILDRVKEHKLVGTKVESKVGMESCQMSMFVYRHLLLAGLSNVVVIDAGEVRAKARKRRQKSDDADAYEICDGVRRDQYVKLVQLPDAFCDGLRQLLGLRRHFIKVRTREVNAIKSALRREGQRHLYKTLTSKVSFERLLKQPALAASMKERIKLHQALWQLADQQVDMTEKKIEEHCGTKSTELNRLQSTPGVGPITSMTMMAFIGDATRFTSAKQVASYAGIVPRTHHSGDRQRSLGITKTGPKELRAMLCEAAHQASRRGHPFNPMFKKLTAKRGYKVAIVAVAHKLCRILWAMIRDNSTFDQSKFGGSNDTKWKALVQAHA